jgi:putative ABC transport system permease protein
MGFFFTLAWRYLWGRKLRTVLTTLSIIFGVMLLFGLNGMLPAMQEAFRHDLMSAANQVDLTISHATGGSFDQAVLATVGGAAGVERAGGVLMKDIVLPDSLELPAASGASISALVVKGIDPEASAVVRPLKIISGRALQPGDTGAVVIGQHLAEATGLAPGSTLRLPAASGAQALSVVGVAEGGVSSGADEVYLPLPAAQALFELPGEINLIEAPLAAGSATDQVRNAVLAQVGPGYRLGGMETGSELMAALELGGVVFTMFGLAALIMGGFIIMITFRTVVAERRRDIGMLRAVGASRRTILGLILTEGLVQGVIGTALGMVFGVIMVRAMLAALKPIIKDQWHLAIGQPSFSAPLFLLAIGCGIGITLVSSLLPARAASRISPLEALRPLAPESGRTSRYRAVAGAVLLALALGGLVSGRPSLSALGALCFLSALIVAGPLLIRPVATVFGRLLTVVLAREGHLAQENLTRQPQRASITVSAVTIGLAILVGLSGVLASVGKGAFSYIDTSLGADYLLLPEAMVLGGGNVGAGPELAEQLRAIPGIEAVATLRQSPARSGNTSLQVIGLDPATYPKVAGLSFSAGQPDAAFAALGGGRELIANGLLAAQLKLKPGDSVTLNTLHGPQSYRVAGIAVDYLNLKLVSAYISQENLARDFNSTGDLLVMANQRPGADAASVRAAVQAVTEQYPAFKLWSSAEWRHSQELAFATSTQSIYYVLMAVLTLPSLLALINTLSINVIERTREIGTLRAVGATRRQVGRLLVGESLLLASLGALLGVGAGIWLSYLLVAATNASGLSVNYVFPLGGVLVAGTAGVLFGLVGALLPARHAARLDIVRALQYE